MAGHIAGEPLECYSIPVIVHKEVEYDQYGQVMFDDNGKPKLHCGFRIGGGIDQDHKMSSQGYPDKGIYITHITENGPAHKAGLKPHDKLLQVNGHDMTITTHKKAVEYIKRKSVLNLLIYRRGIPRM